VRPFYFSWSRGPRIVSLAAPWVPDLKVCNMPGGTEDESTCGQFKHAILLAVRMPGLLQAQNRPMSLRASESRIQARELCAAAEPRCVAPGQRRVWSIASGR
jgi:hypothetical protein